MVLSVSACGADYYVSVKGKDSNPGTERKPFATLERARDAARASRSGGPVTVWIRGGTYVLSHGFLLTTEDSDTVYQTYPNETVRLLGGKAVRGFKKVTDHTILMRLAPAARGQVFVTDLREQGITNFGELTPRGSEQPLHTAALELFFDGKPMQLARWPNREWARIAGVKKDQKDRFQYEGERPAQWRSAEDAWVYGYWALDYVDSYMKVKSIDTVTREIVTYPPYSAWGYNKGHRYYALNLLEELDEPGEWYLDRRSGLLYFWPPAPLKKGEADVSLLEEPIVTLDGASSVVIQGLTVECGRDDAIVIRGGAGNQVKRCTIGNVGRAGVRVEGGERQSVLACEISHTGESGVVLASGDRRTLTPGRSLVEDCNIHDFGRWVRSYRPGVELYGAGNRVAHNWVHDAPHFAIHLHGNDHFVELNEIDHVVQESHDAGALYLGHDYSERGHVVRYNYFHHLGKGELKPKDWVQGVYLDDCASGVVVYAGAIGGGYGNMVMIDHANGYQTLYAHLSQINVRCGQSVYQGGLIGLSGSTGNSTGPHLHFEVRYMGGFVNPWTILP